MAAEGVAAAGKRFDAWGVNCSPGCDPLISGSLVGLVAFGGEKGWADIVLALEGGPAAAVGWDGTGSEAAVCARVP